MKNIKSLELLNFEGPVLKSYRAGEHFVITDQWNKLCGILSSEEMLDFINGKDTISDTSGKKWLYTKEDEGAKPDVDKLLNFLNNTNNNGNTANTIPKLS